MASRYKLSHRLLRQLLLAVLIALYPHGRLRASELGVTSNLLHWATATPNLGVDWGISRHFSTSLSFGYNAINFRNYTTANGFEANPKLHHWLAGAEGKYWFRQTFKGLYLSLHTLGGQYNIGGIKFIPTLRENRYEGRLVGAGIGIGYHIPISSHWGVDLSAGAGYLHLQYNKYNCGSCGNRKGSRTRNLFALTKASIAISYHFSTSSGTVRAPKDIAAASSYTDKPERNYQTGIDTVKQDTGTLHKKEYRDSVRNVGADYSIIPDTTSFVIYYQVDRTDYHPELFRNREELKRLREHLNSIKDGGSTLQGIRIIGYASPEYIASHNLTLASDRARSALTTLILEFEEGVDYPVSLITVGDDWDGLCSALDTSGNQGATALATRIRKAENNETRKDILREAETDAAMRRRVRDIYSRLRRAEIQILHIQTSDHLQNSVIE